MRSFKLSRHRHQYSVVYATVPCSLGYNILCIGGQANASSFSPPTSNFHVLSPGWVCKLTSPPGIMFRQAGLAQFDLLFIPAMPRWQRALSLCHSASC
ncbi:hypothetical protein BJX76DRAFT_142373 [Aspergillus varians]